jgi:hypothetical protein
VPVSTYHDLISAADGLFHRQEFKDAHITYGEALASGGDRDPYCRRMRGISSREVAEQRLQKAVDQPDQRRQFLDQAARWLAKSEAYLDAALEGASEADHTRIRLEQARTEEAMGRFVAMCGGDPERRMTVARRHRDEALQRQA